MFFVYVLRCKDNSFYTGFTNNLKKRLNNHRNGNGSRYVRSRLPFKLVYKEEVQSKSEALKRELKLKSFSKKEKLILIKEGNV